MHGVRIWLVPVFMLLLKGVKRYQSSSQSISLSMEPESSGPQDLPRLEIQEIRLGSWKLETGIYCQHFGPNFPPLHSPSTISRQ